MSIYQLERDGDATELVRLLDESDSAAVRARAADALGDAVEGDPAVVEVLIGAAAADGEERVRTAAVDALDRIGGDALPRLLARLDGVAVEEGNDLPVDVFVDALSHDAPAFRMAAANAIARESITEAAAALVEHLDDPSPQVRLRMVRATGRVGDARAVDPLCALAIDAAPRMRREVATALGEIGGELALDALRPLLEDEDVAVRRDAVTALGNLVGPRPIQLLVECLGDDDGRIRRAAAYAIVDLLSNAPPEESHEMRTGIVEALSASHDEVVVDSLVELFHGSPEAHRRRNAAWLLGRVSGDREAPIETLVAALGDDDEMVRQFAATSLSAIDSPAVEDALVAALDTTFGEGRSMILFTLGTVGSERARTRLLSLLDETDDEETMERTLAALAKLGGI